MNTLLIVLVIFLVLIIVLLFVLKDNRSIKSPAIKKDEIIKEYERELRSILDCCSNKDEMVKQKNIYLKKCSSELSRNIFFTAEESKKIIQKLAMI